MGRGRRDLEFDEDFVRLQHGPARSGAEILRCHDALSLWPGHPALGTQRDERRGGVGRWRAITQVAAHRSAALDLVRSDQVRGLGKPGEIAAQIGVFVNLDCRHSSAQPQPLLEVEADLAELGNLLYVDDMLGAAYSSAQLDDKVGATAQRARLLAVLCEQCDRVFQGFWSFVVDRVQVGISSRTGSARPLDLVTEYRTQAVT